MLESAALKKIPVDWEALLDSMRRTPYWSDYDFLDMETGQVLFLNGDVFRWVRRGEPEPMPWFAPWQEEDIPLARKVLADETGRYAEIPAPDRAESRRAEFNHCERELIRDWLQRWLRSIGIDWSPPPRRKRRR